MAFWNRKKTQPPLEVRRYEAASRSNRLSGWVAPHTDANVALLDLPTLRARSRNLVINNPHAARAVNSITSLTVGYGIRAAVKNNEALENAFQKWADSLQCDITENHDFYGLQRLVMRCVVESGECLIRLVTTKENGSYQLKLQLLEPDYLDTTKHGYITPSGGYVIHGVEFNKFGKAIAYHLYSEHPGGGFGFKYKSTPVAASEIIHVFRIDRAGQVRGAPWLAPVMVKLRDLDQFQDGTLLRQKIANMFAGFVYDETPYDAIADMSDALKESDDDELPDLQPGTVFALKNGRKIEFTDPPKPEIGEFVCETLRDIATGIGITYEELTGDYSKVNFSSARMGLNPMLRNVDSWQWQLLIPVFCERVAKRFSEIYSYSGIQANNATFEWTPPARVMVDPNREIVANIKAIRAGLKSLPEALREQGYNPDKVFKEIAESNAKLDASKLTLDTDPRVDLIKKGMVENAPDL